MTTATLNASSADPLDNRGPQILNDERRSQPQKLASVIHKENCELAAKLHKARFIYAVYGALDGVSLSYSMVKLMFDMHFSDANTSSDKMHDWMMTPGGLAAVASESVFIIAWSLMGNIFEDDDKNTLKSWTVALWGYARISMKAVKNAYKGVRGLMQIVNTLGLADMRHMVVPIGVLLGGLSVANRVWYRYEVNQRKTMMKFNKEALKHLKDFDKNNQNELNPLPYPEDNIRSYKEQIAKQREHYSSKLKLGLLASAAFGGIVDSLYLYLGVLGLSVLTPQLFVAMCVFTAIFSLGCIATRVYEEYDFQRKLDIAQLKVELAISARELESLLFIEIDNVIEQQKQQHDEQLVDKDPIGHHEKTALDLKIEEFDALRDKLQSLSRLSPLSAAFVGLKDGLAAYSMIASIMFATATVCAMAAVTFPPFLMVTGVILGMLSMLGFSAFAVAMNCPPKPPQRLQEATGRNMGQVTLIQQLNSAKSQEKLPILLQILKEDQHALGDIKKIVIKKAIWECMNVDVSPQFYFQEWFEVARSFFSGMAKGQKTVDYTLNPMQIQGQDGHYHESPLMSGLAVASAAVFSVGLALRADTKGFSRIEKTPEPELEQSPLVIMDTVPADTSQVLALDCDEGDEGDEPAYLERAATPRFDMNHQSAIHEMEAPVLMFAQEHTRPFRRAESPMPSLARSRNSLFSAQSKHSDSSPNLQSTFNAEFVLASC